MITAVVLCGRGFNLPASKVIHTVGRRYSSDEVSAEPLAKAYRYYCFESTIA
jgi:O-acetyl-ADP-ribose deacetylase (regulator of RNase III)